MAKIGMNLVMQIIGLDKAQSKLEKAKKEIQNTKPLFDKAVIILEQSHAKTFRMGGRPKWKVSARASRQGGQTLIDTNRLQQTLSATSPSSIREYKKDELKFGTKILYAPAHQFGYPAQGIPMRPFLGVYNEDIKRLEKVFEQDIEARLKVVNSVG